MKLKRIKVENFRSVQTLEIELPQVCAIVGPNNAGKSNILEAIRRVLAGDWGPRASNFSEDDVYLRDAKLDITIECSFEPPIEYRKLKEGDAVQIETMQFLYTRYKRGSQAGTRRLEQTCFNAMGKQPAVMTGYGKRGTPPKFEPLLSIPQEVREAVPLIYIGTDRSLRRQLPSQQYSLLRRIFEGINEDFQNPENKVVVRDRQGNEREVVRTERLEQLLKLVMNLLKTDQFKRVEASIKQSVLEQLGLDADADGIDLYFTPMSSMDFYKNLDLVIKDHGFSISATEVGEGFQNAIVLAVLRAFEETRRQGAILLIEEPEMFLHPQMQRSLYKTLRKIGRTNQVIYTTHSPHFVSVPDYRDVLLVRRNDEGTYVIQSALAADNKRREKLLKELDPERSELFFARRLLLVEGDTEKLSYPAYAAKLKLDLDRAGATIVEVGGKRNLKDFAELAISFQIPVGIVYDKDTFGFKDEDDEAEYNGMLDELGTDDGSVSLWQIDRKHEDAVRRAVGEKKYQELSQRYPNYTNATRQRLIAVDPEMPVPEEFAGILQWLVPKTQKDAGRPAGMDERQDLPLAKNGTDD
jgi:predicted ATP-dependent endonuclease of OLD family